MYISSVGSKFAVNKLHFMSLCWPKLACNCMQLFNALLWFHRNFTIILWYWLTIFEYCFHRRDEKLVLLCKAKDLHPDKCKLIVGTWAKMVVRLSAWECCNKIRIRSLPVHNIPTQAESILLLLVYRMYWQWIFQVV